MNVSYSHAAPFIRERMCQHAYQAEFARTQRDRLKHVHWFFGLREALEILLRADHTNSEAGLGIAFEDELPGGAVVVARHRLDLSADHLFGPERRRQCAQPMEGRTGGHCLGWTVEDSDFCLVHHRYAATVVTPDPVVRPPIIPQIPHIPVIRGPR